MQRHRVELLSTLLAVLKAAGSASQGDGAIVWQALTAALLLPVFYGRRALNRG